MQDHLGAVMPRSRVVWGWVEFAGAFVAIVAVLGLISQWGSLYFVLFGGPARPPSDHEILVYNVTTGVAAVALAAAVTAAFLLGHKILLGVHIVGAFIALGVVVILAFPADRWQPPSGGNPLPADYHPCYSGANDCD
ncbi:hypothetical protein [Frondihabitans sucicola]|nr:hypothetical protein [Frondihabitans sucicola]